MEICSSIYQLVPTQPRRSQWLRLVLLYFAVCKLVIVAMLIFGAVGCSDRANRPESPAATRQSGQVTGDLPAADENHGELPQLSQKEIAALPPDGGPEYNRLVFEQSPYLLLHARNPVDWYPWGEAAFEKAREENRPILLSVGYSTCHWCHVMERESFSDDEVAELLNGNFVAIKVDREERPDIDSVYMEVTQAMTGRGGWPNTVFLTPDGGPFFAGTYFPKESGFGRPGFMELLTQIATAWDTQRDTILESAQEATAVLKQRADPVPGSTPDADTLDNAYTQLAERYDSAHGGFDTRPKFPTPHNLYFLLRYWQRAGEPHALEMVENSLRAMRQGGIFDQVGYGFHRYSTDQKWVLPHFEKMLYDQALLAIAYLETYQATQDEFYASTAGEIFTYVLRDMTSPSGGFYSAENADSEGEEGLFYLWTMDELIDVLGEDDGRLIAKVFNADQGGNFRDEATGQQSERNILYPAESLDARAQELGMSAAALASKVEDARAKLMTVREQRVRPLRDDKILTDWTGLMIAALARGGRVLDEPAYTQAAETAAQLVLEELRDDKGRLLHRYRQGAAGLPAHLEDYAYFIWALLELYETTFDADYLQSAMALTERQIQDFWDTENGGFYQTASGGEELLFRLKELYDGAQPSGNSVSALNLLRLGRITANSQWEEMAEKVMTAFGSQISQGPSAFTHLMCALSFGLGPSFEVVIAGSEDREDSKEMLRALAVHFIPNKAVLFRPDDDATDPPITSIAEYTQYQKALDGKATAYVCRNYACEAPTTEIAVMLDSLKVKQ